jgi:protein-S-isoprenylcysteine O-methyltransferase Ste14
VTERYYIYLSLGWITFCFLHSLFAAIRVKKIIEQWSGKYFTWYRLLYSVGSLIFLIILLRYQLEKKEIALFFPSPVVLIVSVMFILGGTIVMAISALRYFIPVTGLAIFTKQTSDILFDKGIHRVIRHPLYAGTLLLIWGLFLFYPFVSNIIICIIITMYTFIGIKLEEKKLLQQFGETYEGYRRRVPMIIPGSCLRRLKWQIKVDRNFMDLLIYIFGSSENKQ